MMDLQKEREAFQECYKTSRDYKFYVRHEMSEKQIFEFKKGKYVVDCVNDGWKIWQAAKAQAVPEWFDYTKQSPQMDGNYQIFIKGEQITAKWVSRFGFADPIEGDALRQELITHWAMQPQSPKAQEPADD